MNTYGLITTSVHFYRRYVDDTFCLFNKEHEVFLFFESLNLQHDNIMFTVEKETNSTLAFLHVLISNKVPSSFITSIYCKKTLLVFSLIFSILLPFPTNLALSERYWIEVTKLIILFLASVRMLRSSLTYSKRINILKV